MADHLYVSSEGDLLAEDTWDSNDQRSKEECSHDGEGENPLESDKLGEELVDTKRSCEDAKSETNGVVLECHEEEEAINQNTPDSYIGENPSSEAVSIDRNSTIPVQGHECPRQRSRDDWDVNESWMCVMTEIEEGEVEEIDDENNL